MVPVSENAAASDRQTVFVLGSGRSMCALTEAEKRHISGRITVAMNKYLLFWELIGIFPTHFFLADIHHPALRVYEESVRIADTAPTPVHFLLADEYRRLYGAGFLKACTTLPRRLHYYYQNRFWYAPAAVPEKVTYFHRCQKWNAPRVWGETLRDQMYFYRGSLSVLLNLLTVLRIGSTVKLLGVDLNNADCFYQDAIQQRQDLFDNYMKNTIGAPGAPHMTAQPHLGMPGIQAQWPFIRENYERSGIGLYCCNRQSLLVEEGLCPYAPVIDEEDHT